MKIAISAESTIDITEEIKKAAIKYFLQKGFEGASLSEIAEEAG